MSLADTRSSISQKRPAARPEVSLANARRIVHDLLKPNPVIYWTDMLVSFTIAATAFHFVRVCPPFSLAQIGLFMLSCLMFYRLAMFIHEMVHMRAGSFTYFRIVWNILIGIPFLMPSFVYYTHLDHHRRKHYGTDKDGEYLALGQNGRWQMIGFVLSSVVVPIIVVFRCLVLTPLTWFSPKLRKFVYTHASSMVMDPTYIRPLPTEQALRIMRLQETACFLWCLGFAIGVLTFGKFPFPVLLQAYLTSVTVLTLNAIRTLGAHRFDNDEGEMTFLEQLLDSINYPYRPWITELWGPTGTRYHALHHLFPSLPYHNMPEAHRRLMEQLPEDAPYRQTNRVTLISGIIDLWRRSKEVERRHAAERRAARQAKVDSTVG
ncbi:fatty acid desaturase [Blastopirellula sp. JC732]|uniref:Fatty acid desaturase n=1 Tax=Blastopirellula sediminis TaxID=2894196 RepID=A0A9X1MNB8_9BACT|nr:fatty acid desaturase [Blastopirellula sediminis]MCC9606989.1 fatty acid desaturase [Blastopirellula sediminis]MCC9629716.1 fatty acid desaturase [Blastopirellula sediminis]